MFALLTNLERVKFLPIANAPSGVVVLPNFETADAMLVTTTLASVAAEDIIYIICGDVGGIARKGALRARGR